MLSVALLAGGLATRLRPLTETLPKALIPVHGEPFIAHQLRLLRKHDIQHVVICAGYLGAQIQNYVGDGKTFGLRVDYIEDGPHLLGTAGALKQALPLLTPQFFVLYGDSYLPCDYQAVASAFFASKCLGLMTILHNRDQWDKSNVLYQQSTIQCYDKTHHTPHMEHIDYGLGVLDARALQSIPPAIPQDLAVVYQDLLAAHQLAAYEVTERFYEVGSFTGIAELEHYLAVSS